ncbi:MAG: hypothetical protein KGZ49_09180 [Syntrophaceae bacterium]|nr:hypothetical protein [Syntrophaceae bacterium]
MHLPTAILERKKISRAIFSIRPSSPAGQNIYPLMENAYEMGGWCFDLPTVRHLESFKTLRESTEDEALIGFGHIGAEFGVSLMGKPLHQIEWKVVSTIVRNIVPPDSVRKLFPARPYGEVLTQKEIDRMTFDPSRFDRTLSPFQLNGVPFLLIGGKYGDWLLGLGRGDLLKEMVLKIRGEGFIPIFSGQWATFVLPKAKPLDVAGYAIPINKEKSLFDLEQACNMIKKFDKPVISLDPLSEGQLWEKSEEAFSFIFDELKVHSAIAEINSEDEVKSLFKGLEKISSLTPFRKT